MFFPWLVLLPAAVVCLYAAQFVHVRAGAVSRGMAGGDAALYSFSCTVSKFAYALAWLRHRIKPTHSEAG
jgi:hypothetical protein